MVRKKLRRDHDRPTTPNVVTSVFAQADGIFQRKPVVTNSHQFTAESFRFNV
jgi:hypothetical protein